MSALSEHWAMVNTAVIMLALGMRAPTPVNIPVAGLLRAVVLYNIALPSVALAVFYAYGIFGTNTLAALSLCVAAAGGTSAGAFVGAVQGMPGLAVRLFILLLIAEMVISRRRDKSRYEASDTLTSLMLGTVSQVAAWVR